MDLEERDDLPRVMGEIAEVMSARGAALTLHPEDGDRPSVVYANEDAGLGHKLVDGLIDKHITWDPASASDTCRWVNCAVSDNCRDILLIPVEQTPGHSRLIITVYFDDLDEEKRRTAEKVYNRRAPFAVGYFRLWQVNRTRARELTAMKAALNLTEMGILLVDKASKLVFWNRAAGNMLDGGDGLRRFKSSIRATQLRDSVRLQMALEHVIAANGASSGTSLPDRHAPLFSIERSEGPPLIVSVLPTEGRAIEPTDVAAIVYVIDPARNVEELLKPVCKVYRLSPVETRLACLLAGGDTLAQAAKKMRVKEMTARSYLKQVFLKTNTNRQTRLVQLMLSSVIRTTSAIIPEPF